jgi:3,4-dihydroxy 2-butanone 4-phosphate synthase/GTP cyclohydrolase II
MILLDHLQERATAYYVRTGRPFVTLTYAQSLDGSISSEPGEQLILSGSQTKRLTHQLRAHQDASLVGIGTVLADDPKLTARLAGGLNPQPIILDSLARTPMQSQIFQHPTHTPWIAVTDSADAIRCRELEEAGATILRLPGSDSGTVSLLDLITLLAARGITSLMVEGGSQVITSFLKLELPNILILTVAPLLVGGLRGVDRLYLRESQRYPSLKEYEVEQMGHDLVIWGELHWGDS